MAFDLYADRENRTGDCLVIIADNPLDASTYAFDGPITVADANPEYPEDDDVLLCAYKPALDTTFGDRWMDWPPRHLAYLCGRWDVPLYAFPSERLVRPDE